MKIHFSILPRARQDMEEHFAYISSDNHESGLRFFNAAFKSFEMLVQMPSIGTIRNFQKADLRGLRMWFVEDFDKYLIFYRLNQNTLEIIRVLHSARDVERILLGKDE